MTVDKMIAGLAERLSPAGPPPVISSKKLFLYQSLNPQHFRCSTPFLPVSFRAGVPNRAILRHAYKYRNYMNSHAVGDTSSDLVGSARVQRPS